MNPQIRTALTSNSISRKVYFAARNAYHALWTSRSEGKFKAAETYFLNVGDFHAALRTPKGSELIELRTVDGLSLTIRKNRNEAATVGEIFLLDCYDFNFSLPKNPIVIDVGGFIGDFALYAVRKLNAQKVIVYEPSPQNWELLRRNIAINGYSSRIEPVNKAVTETGRAIMMNVDIPAEQQSCVSEFTGGSEGLVEIPCVSLEQLFLQHKLGSVDLLKLDCEGSEYGILEGISDDLLGRIRNLVFEYHSIEGFGPRLKRVNARLLHAGFRLKTRGGLVSASRT